MLNGSHYGEWWSNQTFKAYQKVRQCTQEAYKSYRMGSGFFKDQFTVSLHEYQSNDYSVY